MRLVASMGLLGLVPLMAHAADVRAIDWEMQIDGSLDEWGAAERIAVDPGGELVGLRGVFRPEGDHEVEVMVLWDAQNLFVAAVVGDDSIDVARIAPADKAWHGPSGERQDRMFYYDHLNVFVLDPLAYAGTNVWMSIGTGEVPYIWGHRQRRPPREDIPVVAGSQITPPTYTYELALPWQWLEIHPVSGMVLEARFMFIDSDLPGLSIGTKVRKGTAKWIWWKGTLTLVGEPPGLEPPPVAEAEPEPEAARAPEELVDSRVHEAIARLKARQERARAEELVERRLAAEAAAAAPKAVSAAGPAPSATPTGSAAEGPLTQGTAEEVGAAVAARRTSSMSIRDRLRKQLQVVEVHAPEWFRQVGEGSGLTSAQIDSFAASLDRNLTRLAERRISSRTDILVLDMAAAASSPRSLAREFLQDLLVTVSRETAGPAGALWPQVTAAAARAEVDVAVVASLIEELTTRAAAVYEKGEVTTTGELLKKCAGKTQISKDSAMKIARCLFDVDDDGR